MSAASVTSPNTVLAGATVWDLVAEAARSRPDTVVLADDHGRRLDTATVARRAEEVAAGLLARGLRPGDVVTWQLPTGLEAATLMLACARVGLVQNPIIPLFRREAAFIVEQLDPALVVVPTRWQGWDHRDQMAAGGFDVLALDLEGLATVSPGAADAVLLPTGDPTGLPDPPADAEPVRWIYYTSGTTADPKGACHTDRSLIASSNGPVEHIGMVATDVYPIAWPIAHIGGIAMLIAALRTGGRLVFFDTFDPATAATRMAAHSPTILGSATPFFRVYLDAQRAHGPEPLFPELRTCVAGGAPTSPTVNREVRAELGVSGVVGSWGLTEFPVATSERPDGVDVGTTVGTPTRGVSVRVVDGELRLKGPPCFNGYVDETLNDDAFDDDGWFRTGDLGSIDEDGTVRIVGRLKDVIVRNAENISALEVEEVLETHPAVAQVAVIGVPHERTGEQVCAVVVAASGEVPTLEGLVEHCRRAGLARFKHPESLRIVQDLPRNSMGKIVRRDLSADAASRADASG